MFKSSLACPKLAILDRDKTIVRVPPGIHHLCGDEPIEFIDGAVDFLRGLREIGAHVVVATNQPGIDDRSCAETLELTRRFHDRLNRQLAEVGAEIDRFYVCPHRPSERCPCRKPRGGMFAEALGDQSCSSENALAVGDQLSDMRAAAQVGISQRFLLRERCAITGPIWIPVIGYLVGDLKTLSEYLKLNCAEMPRQQSATL